MQNIQDANENTNAAEVKTNLFLWQYKYCRLVSLKKSKYNRPQSADCFSYSLKLEDVRLAVWNSSWPVTLVRIRVGFRVRHGINRIPNLIHILFRLTDFIVIFAFDTSKKKIQN